VFIKIRALIGLAALIIKILRGGRGARRKQDIMSSYSGRNDLTTISSWWFDIKAFKSDMRSGIPVFRARR